MQGAGIPTLLMGSTGGNRRGVDEWVCISELVQLCAILDHVVTGYLT
jgi:hypothetical protein